MSKSSSQTLEQKLEKKLEVSAKRIQKKRKQGSKKEEDEYSEIRFLLQHADNLIEKESGDDSDYSEKSSCLSNTESIPNSTQGIQVFKKDLCKTYFNESSLKVKAFFQKNSNLLGLKLTSLSEACFRDIIIYSPPECPTATIDECPELSLYVLYLLSVHPDNHFVSLCFNFLLRRKFHLNIKDILTILLNLGADPNVIISGSFQVDTTKFNPVVKTSNEETCYFPYFNLEMVGQLLIIYADECLILLDQDTQIFIKALTKISLEPLFRSSSMFSTFSTLLSLVASHAVKDHSLDYVVRGLYLPEEHLLNQIYVSSVVIQPHSQIVKDALTFMLMKNILKCKNSNGDEHLEVKSIKYLIQKSEFAQTLNPLETYCFLELLTSSLPSLTASSNDFNNLNNIITVIEKNIFPVRDLADTVILKASVAKLKSLLIIRKGNRFLLAADKPKRGK